MRLNQNLISSFYFLTIILFSLTQILSFILFLMIFHLFLFFNILEKKFKVMLSDKTFYTDLQFIKFALKI